MTLVQWIQRHPKLSLGAIYLVLCAIWPQATLALPLIFGALQLDDVNTVVTKEIEPGVVDGYFKAGPAVAMARKRFTRKWIGPQIQSNFIAR